MTPVLIFRNSFVSLDKKQTIKQLTLLKIMTSNIISNIKKDTIWEGTSFSQFKVSKVVKTSGKIWVHYYVIDNPSKKYSCYEEAFKQRFNELTNLY